MSKSSGKQMPGVKREQVEPGKLFGRNPMAGSKKPVKDDRPHPVPKKGSPMARLANKRI